MARHHYYHHEVETTRSSAADDDDADEGLDFTMYTSMIDLQQQIETLTHLLEEKEAEEKELVNKHEREKKELIKKYEQEIQAVRRNGQIEMAQVVRQNRILIDEIMSAHEDMIQAWKVQYEMDTEDNQNKMMTSRSPSRPGQGQDVASALLFKFKALSSQLQVCLAAGIGTFCLTFQSYSWTFIAWAWPRLESFASKIQSTVGEGKCLMALYDFSQSEEFSQFLQIWERDGVLAIENLVKKYSTELVTFTHLLLSTHNAEN